MNLVKRTSIFTLGEFSGDFRTPCVLFTGHPSLRFGDAVHFIEMWKNTSANAIIFTGKKRSIILSLLHNRHVLVIYTDIT